MDIQEIIEQEEKSFIANNNVKAEIKNNKTDILLPLAMVVFDFFEIIQKDKNFVFTCAAHPRDEDYSPLFSETSLTLEYYRDSATKSIKESAFSRVLLRSFGYGNGQSRYIAFGVDDNFKPYFTFSNDLTPKDSEKHSSTDEVIRVMTKFFLQRRKK